MKTRYLKLDCDNIDLSGLNDAAEIIRSGGLVAFPTETVYGLGADALNASAADKIYEAKGRPSNNPLIVHVSKPQDAEKYVYTDKRYYKIAEAFMPGPITVIMPSKRVVADAVCAGLDTLAVRCPSHPIARAAAHVCHDLDGRIDMIIDGGECEVGLESTIIKLEADRCVLLRPGGITHEMLSELLGDVEIAHGVIGRPDENTKVESPGMLISHYAPKAPLYLVRGELECVNKHLEEKLSSDGVFVLSFDGLFECSDRVISLGADYTDAAKRLFSALREADRLGAAEIYAPYPSQDGIGLALLNRMLRAAAYRIVEV